MTEKENIDIEDLDIEDLDKEICERLEKLDLQDHLKELEELRENYPFDKDAMIDSYCNRAKILYKSNRSEDSISLLKKGMKIYHNQPELICYTGFACLAQESWEAKTYFLRHLKLSLNVLFRALWFGYNGIKIG